MKYNYNTILNVLLFLIISTTIYISTILNLNTNNFSDLISISNPIIYLWSIICSSYTVLNLKIIKKYNKNILLYIFKFLNLIIFIPYNPINNMLVSQVHIILAILGFIFLMYTLLKEIYYYMFFKAKYYLIIKYLFIIMILLLSYIYLEYSMINTKFQLVFIILYVVIIRILSSNNEYYN